MVSGSIFTNEIISRFSADDESIIVPEFVYDHFGGTADVAEWYVRGGNQVLVKEIPYERFRPSSENGLGIGGTIQHLYIDPVNDLIETGFETGRYTLLYNFFRNLTRTSFFIKEISGDRTELRLATNELTNDELFRIGSSLKSRLESVPYGTNWLLSFGDETPVLIVNFDIDTDSGNYSLLVKLYEPLPADKDLKSVGRLVEEIIPSRKLDVILTKTIEEESGIQLREPNFSIALPGQNSSTEYSQVTASVSLFGGVNLNVDYSNYENFVHFSSAVERTSNFLYKIEQLQYLTDRLTGSLAPGESTRIQSEINRLSNSFDGYETYLSSSQYPTATGSLLPTTNPTVTAWYEDQIASASVYDDHNPNNLTFQVPEFLLEDEANEPYRVTMTMVGQFFDERWLYSRHLSDIYRAWHRGGISPDLVKTALVGFGLNLNEQIDPDYQLRLYHNLPFLSKARGTATGVRGLFNLFGIPASAYQIKENGQALRRDWYGYAVSGAIQVPHSSSIKTLELQFYPETLLTGSLIQWPGVFTFNIQSTGFQIVSGSTVISLPQQYETDEWSHVNITITPTGSASVVNFRVNGANLSSSTGTLTISSSQLVSSGSLTVGSVPLYYRELRYWSTQFDSGYDRLTNPRSVVGISSGSFMDDLLYRLPLGSYGNTSSLAPVTYSGAITGSGFAVGTLTYKPFRDTISIISSRWIPTSSTIFTDLSTRFVTPVPIYRTDMSFSPQNEVDDDIADSISGSVLTNLEGDPEDLYRSTYTPIKQVLITYARKLSGGYGIADYIRTIEQIPNTLFQLSPKHVPLRSAVTNGILIRNHKLEAPKVKYIKPVVEIDGHSVISFKPTSVTAEANKPIPVRVFGKTRHKNPYLLPKSVITGWERTLYNARLSQFWDESVTPGIQISQYLENGTSVLVPGKIATYESGLRGIGSLRYRGTGFPAAERNASTLAPVQAYNGYVGLFTDAIESLIFPGNTALHLKYLVDQSGSLIDLNQRNRNWSFVQNLFDDHGVVSQFNPGLQKRLDGNKSIVEAGWRYSPLVYGSQFDRRFKFEVPDSNRKYAVEYTLTSDVNITKIPTYYTPFPTKLKDQGNPFIDPKPDLFHTGSQTLGEAAHYDVVSTGQYRIEGNVNLRFQATTLDASATIQIAVYRNTVNPANKIDSISYAYNPKPGGKVPDLVKKRIPNPTISIENTLAFSRYWAYERTSLGKSIPFSSDVTWAIQSRVSSGGGFFATVFKSSHGYVTPVLREFYGLESNGVFNLYIEDAYYAELDETIVLTLPSTVLGSGTFTGISGTILKRIVGQDGLVVRTYFNKGDKIVLRLEQSQVPTPNVTITLQKDSTIKIFRQESTVGLTTPPVATATGNQIQFNEALTEYFTGNSRFSPSGSLPYGDIDESLPIIPGDFIYLYNESSDESAYRTIKSVDVLNRRVTLTLFDSLPPAIDLTNLTKWLVFRKIKDETQVRLVHFLQSGSVGAGLLLPKELDPLFLNSIDTISREIKEKLIQDGEI